MENRNDEGYEEISYSDAVERELHRELSDFEYQRARLFHQSDDEQEA